jgi:hypothetical protein
MCRVNDAPRLGSIRCPVLGVVGGMSRTAVGLMERVVAPVPGARLEVVGGAFDPTNLCRPDEFNRLLAGFLREVGW